MDFLGSDLALEGEQDLPLVRGEVHGLDLGHVRGRVGDLAGVDGLAPDVADAEDKDALGGHEPEVFGPDAAAEEFGMFLQGKAPRSLEGGPEPVIGPGGRAVGGTQDDVSAERVFPEHEVEGGVETFGGDLPGDQGAGGQVGGQESLADAPDRPGAQHGANSLENRGQVDPAARGDFAERVGAEPGDLVLADRQDTGVDGVEMFDGAGGGNGGGVHGGTCGHRAGGAPVFFSRVLPTGPGVERALARMDRA